MPSAACVLAACQAPAAGMPAFCHADGAGYRLLINRHQHHGRPVAQHRRWRRDFTVNADGDLLCVEGPMRDNIAPRACRVIVVKYDELVTPKWRPVRTKLDAHCAGTGLYSSPRHDRVGAGAEQLFGAT